MADYNADDSNKMAVNTSFPKSGLSAGVTDGLSMVESLPRGNVEAEQKTSGSIFRQDKVTESVSGNGKNFNFLR
jgi:hypothetical protein